MRIFEQQIYYSNVSDLGKMHVTRNKGPNDIAENP